jgi:hypothetical protein
MNPDPVLTGSGSESGSGSGLFSEVGSGSGPNRSGSATLPRGPEIWDGEGMEMGKSVYEQPGTRADGILSHHGGFPSK